jgi:uncharacterized protein (DUF433 family)
MTTPSRASEHKTDRAPAPVSDADRLEQAVPPWQHLVYRAHGWRKQLSLKGRKMTVGQLVMTMRANQMTPEDASVNFSLPLDAIREALNYASAHDSLIRAEAAEERRRLQERGHALEPEDLPR